MSVFTPYPHQKAGIDWIVQHKACALLWGMGTGKTVTTLTAIDRLLFDEMEDGPVLVIAPKRVAENTWSKEAAKWEHLRHLRVRRIMARDGIDEQYARLRISAQKPDEYYRGKCDYELNNGADTAEAFEAETKEFFERLVESIKEEKAHGEQ